MSIKIYTFVHFLLATSRIVTGDFNNVTVDNFDTKEWHNELRPNYNSCQQDSVLLDPCSNSDDSFTIERNMSEHVAHKDDLLRITATGKYYDKYCLDFTDNTTYRARICHSKSNSSTHDGYTFLIINNTNLIFGCLIVIKESYKR